MQIITKLNRDVNWKNEYVKEAISKLLIYTGESLMEDAGLRWQRRIAILRQSKGAI